jgi:hypothetical protein
MSAEQRKDSLGPYLINMAAQLFKGVGRDTGGSVGVEHQRTAGRHGGGEIEAPLDFGGDGGLGGAPTITVTVLPGSAAPAMTGWQRRSLPAR